MKVLALIPARSGSKGIKDKNITSFQGMPLMAHTIQSAIESGVCDEVFVCTDSQYYADIAKDYGASVPFLRSQESATDESRSIDCVLESLQRYKEMGKEFDVLVLLQPTSPLRNARHIQEAYRLFEQEGFRSLASVCRVREHPLFMRTLQNHRLEALLDMPSSVRRQDLQEVYRINGAIYINLVSMMTLQTSFNDNQIGYVMQEAESLDIDSEQDLMWGALCVTSQKQSGKM
ncbi:acylneuraminate cytidylyltransferase [Helicobacter enhydrae]|uniref:Acylneuraminate cytidylyltransferase n=1 Tax=Helicobacter enhydrae TaxID=222136 RepID=A0A1B1U7K1_9HELI|nr:acylneuraminate cytidylyltransferase family protein [Helicobacter enhydrae]ANV98763.1 acylneuraminate cytidylyltransferase [Helicobacter enhydrae]